MSNSSSADSDSDGSIDISNNLEETNTESVVAAVPVKIFPKDYNLHELKMPTAERIVKDVEPPSSHILTDEEFWTKDGLPNCLILKEHLKKEGRISSTHLVTLIDRVYEVFCAEENVLEVDAPVTVCGDIHGQYYDLLKLIDIGGDPSETNYLFLGDYVDRGNFSMECIILLFSYKLCYPTTFWMLRGNHECRHLTDYFTFREECEHKYSRSIYESFMDCFDALPLAAVMNKQFFCVHGGLSPEVDSIDDIRTLDRYCEPPPSGPMCDLLWADPMETFTGEIDTPYEYNTVRGCSYNFSYNAVCDFLERTGMLSVIRAHEAQDAGYRMHRRHEKTGFPSLITLFSAPNYLDAYNNKGAIMRYENNVINIRQFNCSPHPYYLPGFINVFNWSLPFVAEKVGEVLLYILNSVDDARAELEERERMREFQDRERKREALRNKVRTVSRMLRIYKTMREESLSIGILSNAKGASTTPAVLLSSSPEKPITFEEVKTLDSRFEGRPPGIQAVLEAAKMESFSPDGMRRRQSRDKILSLKKQQELKAKYAMKIFDTKDMTPPEIIKSVETDPPLSHSVPLHFTEENTSHPTNSGSGGLGNSLQTHSM